MLYLVLVLFFCVGGGEWRGLQCRRRWEGEVCIRERGWGGGMAVFCVWCVCVLCVLCVLCVCVCLFVCVF